MGNYDYYDDNEEVEVICSDCKDYFTLPTTNSHLELDVINGICPHCDCIADHIVTDG